MFIFDTLAVVLLQPPLSRHGTSSVPGLTVGEGPFGKAVCCRMRSQGAEVESESLWHFSCRPDGIGTVTVDEKERFEEIKERLRVLLENQITHFRYCFPFGRPEGALKATLSLLERVLMKDIVTPVPQEEVKTVIRKCLEQAALVNYTRLSEYAKIEGKALSF